jgi:ornithine--oxo-acid transaminase
MNRGCSARFWAGTSKGKRLLGLSTGAPAAGSGWGRSGKLFAFEHEGVCPDIVIVGKAMGGGMYPISAILARREILDVFTPGDHGSTFGGNPLACAVARASIKVLVDEKLPERSARLGALALKRLQALRSPLVKEVRGIGLWLAIELHCAARPLCERLKERGLLCKETHDNVIRLAPPLVIEESDLLWALDEIEAVLGRQEEEHPQPPSSPRGAPVSPRASTL